ncbi:hypothetical protein CCAX7_20280 [Capsulimonas corticalis]|uniref:Uncharacterized protein n=1 Tax=Capsulimonas corticalis TaxID=2219043 RepID=A0A402D2F8_9BACT|nr:hypothetical protein [Capsulimonas corticalis]BDI29977.1 hypothetical protein CCAX7_20280 [Capsulimonas corticalis]
MELRAILTPPLFYEDQARRLIGLADEIIAHLSAGRNPDKLIETFNELSAGSYGERDFHGVAEGEGVREFIREVLTPGAPWVMDISREEYLEIIRRIASADYDDAQTLYWLDLLNRNLSHPAISDVIFREGNTTEEALDKMQTHKPIAL